LADSYIYLWAYEVSPEAVDDFCELYGPEGPWVALFRKAPGYLDTQLLEDRSQTGRFVTIDRWESEEAFSNFRAKFGDEFDRLDQLGERLTVRETPLGGFRGHRRD
jgi:heme-degrading monooxygenase HmoA